MTETGEVNGSCALEGCTVPVVRSKGGGRPRLYCSDAHRVEARRRRMGGAPQPLAGTDDPLEETRQLLAAAMHSLHQAPRLPSYDAVLADARAAATGEVLRAQQAAADAVRRLAEIETRLGEERALWELARQGLDDGRRQDAERIAQLEAALEGSRAALDAELIAHHESLARAEAELGAQRAVLDATRSSLEEQLAAERRHLEEADACIRASEVELAAARSQLQGLQDRTAAAEVATAAASTRIAFTESQLRHTQDLLAEAERSAAANARAVDQLSERPRTSHLSSGVRASAVRGARRYRPGAATS